MEGGGLETSERGAFSPAPRLQSPSIQSSFRTTGSPLSNIWGFSKCLRRRLLIHYECLRWLRSSEQLSTKTIRYVLLGFIIGILIIIRISINLLAFYHEYCSLIAYATHYPVVESE